MLNFQLNDDSFLHVCEVQLVHQRLMTDRKAGEAHQSYTLSRAAFELLEAAASSPPGGF